MKISFGSKQYTVTACPKAAPTARTTFVIDRAAESKSADDDDDVLCYGMPFSLKCNDSLLVDQRTNMLKVTAACNRRVTAYRVSAPCSRGPNRRPGMTRHIGTPGEGGSVAAAHQTCYDRRAPRF